MRLVTRSVDGSARAGCARCGVGEATVDAAHPAVPDVRDVRDVRDGPDVPHVHYGPDAAGSGDRGRSDG